MKKTQAELAAAWLRKASSDLATAETCQQAGRGLDAACFHCQQAAEKSLKAFLISRDQDYPRTHDLRRLIGLCTKVEARFKRLEEVAKRLNPYAVDFRYEPDFWPDAKLVNTLITDARAIMDFAAASTTRLPTSPKTGK